MPGPVPRARRPRLHVEPLEARALPTVSYTDAPVVPEIGPEMKAHLQAVHATGQAKGERDTVFAKAGDSITFLSSFLDPLGASTYDPTDPGTAGAYTNLADTVKFFHSTSLGSGTNSFTRTSTAATAGWRAEQVVSALPGELDAIHPSIALVMIGTNDASWDTQLDTTFRGELETIVDEAESRGVIVVLSTVPDHMDTGGKFEPRTLQVNQVIAEVAAEKDVPLWNYWLSLQTLPNHGMDSGGVHPSVSPQGAGYFAGDGLSYGMNVRNVTALQVLQMVKGIVFDDAPPGIGPSVEPLTPWLPLSVARPVVVAGADQGDHPYVGVFDAASGQLLSRFEAFDPSFTGGVRVAVADMNGDGYTDIICAAGPGGGPHVKVFSGRDGSVIEQFFAYGPGFAGGVFVAVGDVTGDGIPDIVTGAGAGGGPHVKVFDGQTGTLLNQFFAYAPGFAGGVSVAVGDVLGEGRDQVVTGAGPGGGPHVKVFDGPTGQELESYFAYSATFAGGVSVAVGDVDGDGRTDVITGAGAGGGPNVRVFDGATEAMVGSFFAFDPSFGGGVRVAAADLPGGAPLIVVTPGRGDPPTVRRFQGAAGRAVPGDITALDPTFLGGLFVGGS
jgi:lysophospholipase L1-like esterase